VWFVGCVWGPTPQMAEVSNGGNTDEVVLEVRARLLGVDRPGIVRFRVRGWEGGGIGGTGILV